MIEFVGISPDAWEWIYGHIRPILTEGTKGVFAKRDGEFVAGTIFDNWTSTSAQIHVVVTDPIVFKHQYIQECMNYFFNTADREILIGITPSNNKRALKFNRHVGLKELFRIRDGFMFGVDLVVQELRKDDCRWIENG